MTIPTHHSAEASAGDRGIALGRAQADRIARNADVYMRLFELKAGLGTV